MQLGDLIRREINVLINEAVEIFEGRICLLLEDDKFISLITGMLKSEAVYREESCNCNLNASFWKKAARKKILDNISSNVSDVITKNLYLMVEELIEGQYMDDLDGLLCDNVVVRVVAAMLKSAAIHEHADMDKIYLDPAGVMGPRNLENVDWISKSKEKLSTIFNLYK